MTVREFARDRLAENGETDATRDRHLTHYLALAEQADQAMLGPDEERSLSQLDVEVDNLRLAQEWAIARGDVEAEWRLVAALALFWVFRGYLREGAERWPRRCRARMRPPRCCKRGSSKAPGRSPAGPATTNWRSPATSRAWPPRRRRGRPLWRHTCSAGWESRRTSGATLPAPARFSPRRWPRPARSIPGR